MTSLSLAKKKWAGNRYSTAPPAFRVAAVEEPTVPLLIGKVYAEPSVPGAANAAGAVRTTFEPAGSVFIEPVT